MNQTLNETKELDVNNTIAQVLSIKSKIEEIQDVQRKGEIDQVNHDIQQDNDDKDKDNVDSGNNSDEELAASPKYNLISFYFFITNIKCCIYC